MSCFVHVRLGGEPGQRLCLSVDLGMLQSPTRKAGGGRWGEKHLDVSAETSAPVTQQKIDSRWIHSDSLSG